MNIRWNVAIETLPDEVLLEIFDLYLYEEEGTEDPWQNLGDEKDEKDCMMRGILLYTYARDGDTSYLRRHVY